MSLIEQIIRKNKKEKLIVSGDTLVVGFSGGPDSVFMTEMLLKLKENIDFNFVLVHINHLLRGEDSDGDENFCVEYAEKNNLRIFVRKIDVKKIEKAQGVTLEEAGRKARYAFYNEILKKVNGNKIALAHNKDDQVETFMFRLIRGAGLSGLEGIISKREHYIRPISEIYKKDILNYLDENGIAYRIDKTNFENEFTRNSIRLDLIPFIEKRYNPKFKDKLYSLIEEIRDINSVVDYEVEKIGEKNYLDTEELKRLSRHIRGKVIGNFLYKYGVKVNRKKIFLIEKILEKGGSCTLDLSEEYILKKEYNILKIEKSDIERKETLPQTLVIPGKVRFGNYEIVACICNGKIRSKEYFCTSLKSGDVVTVRKREPGDRMVPTGMKSEKKIKEILINEKIPLDERDAIPLIVYGNEIVWIAGVRGNEKYNGTVDDKCVKFIVRRIK
ncbi:tRNA lysidine(34) synthetase TilS [Fusobacterium sp.]|uniref:tRNA lysidine(34) synthetase TilS n=1 Tax=Fusobacterium sp. TaxID=68766 RepID=UPI00396C3403